MYALAKEKANRVGLMVAMACMAVFSSALMESLNVEALLDTEKMFEYANVLINALAAVVLLGLGFMLAKFIIRFVLNIFNSFNI